MAKFLLFVIFLSFTVSINLMAQNSGMYYKSPFKNVKFLSGTKDTITLVGNYRGVVDTLSEATRSTLSSIKKLHGLHSRRFTHSLMFTIDGNSKQFNAPIKSTAMLSTLAKDTKLRLKCIVYRFFFTDPVDNFFYIDKVGLL